MTVSSYVVVDLRERLDFAPIVADRVWRAWWKPKGYALKFIEGLVEQSLNNEMIPLTLVAHHEGTFLETASVIASDLDARPQYTPWVATIWVDAVHRSNGIGTALVQAAVETAQGLGFDPVYLGALPPKHEFYKRLGWRLIEADVTAAGLAVFRYCRLARGVSAHHHLPR